MPIESDRLVCKQIHCTSLVAVLTSSDRRYSFHIRYLWNVLVAVLCFGFAFYDFCWYRCFCHWIVSFGSR